MGSYHVQILRSRDEIEALRDFWSACNPGRDCDLDFYLFVADHIDGCLRPHVILLLEDGIPRALLAGRLDVGRVPIRAGYYTLPVPSIRILRIVHGGCLGEITHERARLLIGSVNQSLAADEADAAMLESVEVNSPIAECARQLPSRLCRDRLIYPQIHRMRDMAASSGTVQSHLSSHARTAQRQRTTKLKRAFGDVRIKRVRSCDEVPGLIRDAERIAQRSYQSGLGVGFSRTPFVESRLAFEAQKGWLRAYVLYLDEDPCAFWIGSLRNGAFISNYLAFDPSYSEYSPGMYLLLIAMEDVLADASIVRLFDFGIGDAGYKERLSNRFVEEAPIYVFAPRIKALGINALRSTVGVVNHSIKHSSKLAPQVNKIKRWLRRRAAERA